MGSLGCMAFFDSGLRACVITFWIHNYIIKTSLICHISLCFTVIKFIIPINSYINITFKCIMLITFWWKPFCNTQTVWFLLKVDKIIMVFKKKPFSKVETVWFLELTRLSFSKILPVPPVQYESLNSLVLWYYCLKPITNQAQGGRALKPIRILGIVLISL